MTTTIDDLITPIETEEFKTSLYRGLAHAGVTVTNWKPGAVVRTIIAILAIVLHALSVLISNIARMGFLEFSTGPWLSRKARYDYGVAKRTASFASGTVLVSNASASSYPLNPDDLEVASSITGKSYRNTAALTIIAGASNVPVVVSAAEAGIASSAMVGEIDRVLSPLAGLSVTNTQVFVGLDDEDEADLKNRCQALWVPPATGDAAYLEVAQAVTRADGSKIAGLRLRPVSAPGGIMYVFCATDTGALSSDDLALVDEALQTQCATLGLTLFVQNAEPVAVPITYKAWAWNTTGLSEAQMLQTIQDDLRAYLGTVPIGGNVLPDAPGFLYRDDISAEISRSKYKSTSTRVFRVKLESPSSDLLLFKNQFPVLGAVDAMLTRVSPNRGAT